MSIFNAIWDLFRRKDNRTCNDTLNENKRRVSVTLDNEIDSKRRKVVPEDSKIDCNLRLRNAEPLKEVNYRIPRNDSSLNFSFEGRQKLDTKFTSSTPSDPSRNSIHLKSPPTLCLNRVRDLNEKTTYVEMLRRCAPSKQENKSRNVMKMNSRKSLEIENNLLNSNNSSKLATRTIIDLTEEDDEEQKPEIEPSIFSSPSVKFFNSNFIARNHSVANEEYISNIVRKYELKMRNKENEASHVKKAIHKHKEDLNNVLAEILQQRLSLKEHKIADEQKPSYEIAPITNTITTAIRNIESTKRVPLVQIKDTAVKSQDICTLDDCCWLNDEVINAYMNLIEIRSEQDSEKYPKVHCFNTFLYEQLQKKGHSSVRRWTKKIDVFDYALLIVPIHLGHHWCLIEIRIKEKCINYYDSMGSSNNRCLQLMIQYLVDELKDKKNDVMEPSEWKLVNVPSNVIPQQSNSYDCGVFACTYAEHLTRQAPFNFTQEHMQYFRTKMKYEILTGKLIL